MSRVNRGRHFALDYKFMVVRGVFKILRHESTIGIRILSRLEPFTITRVLTFWARISGIRDQNLPALAVPATTPFKFSISPNYLLFQEEVIAIKFQKDSSCTVVEVV